MIHRVKILIKLSKSSCKLTKNMLGLLLSQSEFIMLHLETFCWKYHMSLIQCLIGGVIRFFLHSLAYLLSEIICFCFYLRLYSDIIFTLFLSHHFDRSFLHFKILKPLWLFPILCSMFFLWRGFPSYKSQIYLSIHIKW